MHSCPAARALYIHTSCMHITLKLSLHAMEVVTMQFLTVGLAMLIFLLAFRRRRGSNHDSRHARTMQAAAPPVIVRDPDLIRRMVLDHADHFSNRPSSPLPVDLDAGQPRTHSITSAPYGPLWRVLRGNLTANVLHPSRLAGLLPFQRDAIEALVADLSARGGEPVVVVVRDGVYAAVFQTMARVCFGDGVGERDVRAMRRTLHDFIHTSVDFGLLARSRVARLLRWRQWRYVVTTRRRLAEVFGPAVAARRQSRKRGRGGGGGGVYCYVDSLLDLRIPNDGGEPAAGGECHGGRRALRDDEVVRLVWEFLAASTDSVVACIEWTLARLVAAPEVQKKLYHELTGGDQTKGEPHVADERLRDTPYLRAVILESLRLHPPLPLIVRDVGPEGAAVAGTPPPHDGTLTRFIFMADEFGRDRKAWTDPDEFRPERFLVGGEGEDVRPVPGPKEVKMMPFGAGRRSCPGSGLAMVHIASFVSALVREFEWTPPADGAGVDLKETYALVVKVMASPLRACITRRMSQP